MTKLYYQSLGSSKDLKGYIFTIWCGWGLGWEWGWQWGWGLIYFFAECWMLNEPVQPELHKNLNQ